LRAALPHVAGGTAGALVALAAVDLLTVPGVGGAALAAAAAGTAVLLLALALLARRRAVPASWGPPLAAVAVLVVVGHAAVEMAVTGGLLPTAFVVLAVVLAGAVLSSVRWLVGTLYLAWGAWVAAVAYLGWQPGLPMAALSVVAGSALALALNQLLRGQARQLALVRNEVESSTVRDPLTGLANRRGLAMIGSQIVEQARRQGDAVHCIFIDVEGLRAVKQSLGEAAGDAVLCAVADALRTVTRSTDVVARWGGAAFCVVGPGPGMAPMELERRVRDAASEAARVPAGWTPGIGAGGAMLAPWDAGTLDTLLGKAGQEMYLRRSLRREGSPAPRTATAE
jgi:diguanylate cyclase (GGDEF)-like protein